MTVIVTKETTMSELYDLGFVINEVVRINKTETLGIDAIEEIKLGEIESMESTENKTQIDCEEEITYKAYNLLLVDEEGE